MAPTPEAAAVNVLVDSERVGADGRRISAKAH